MAKIAPCLWFSNQDAEEAAQFYVGVFGGNSKIDAVNAAPSDFPSGKRGDVLTVEFTLAGVQYLGLNAEKLHLRLRKPFHFRSSRTRRRRRIASTSSQLVQNPSSVVGLRTGMAFRGKLFRVVCSSLCANLTVQSPSASWRL